MITRYELGSPQEKQVILRVLKEYIENDNMPEIYRMTNKRIINSSVEDNLILREAIRLGKTRVLRGILNYSHLDPGLDENRALFLAINNDNSRAIKLLIEDPRVDPSYPLNLPVLTAAEKGNNEAFVQIFTHPRVQSPTEFDWTKTRNLGVAYLLRPT